MWKRLRTNARKKLRQALSRIERVVIMDIRRMLEQQKKWKAKVLHSKSNK